MRRADDIVPTPQKPADAAAEGAAEESASAEPVTLARRVRTWVKELAIVGVSAIVLSLIIKTFFFQSFWIPSESMESTLDVGDRILVTKWRPGPLELRHGDIVVFKDPGDWLGGSLEDPQKKPTAFQRTLTFVGLRPEDSGEHLVKRVVGLPGDHVVCCDAEGRLKINGFSLDEPYLDTGIEPSARKFNIVVPPNYVWVMGDNRPNSGDSRVHMGDPGGGAISMDLIVGTAFVTVWPLDHWRGFGNPFEGVDIPPPVDATEAGGA